MTTLMVLFMPLPVPVLEISEILENLKVMFPQCYMDNGVCNRLNPSTTPYYATPYYATPYYATCLK